MVDECGVTPLVWAIEGRCFTVATMLLELAPELLSMEVSEARVESVITTDQEMLVLNQKTRYQYRVE